MDCDDIALFDDWSSKDCTVPSTSTVLKNKVLVFGGLYVVGPSLDGFYMLPWVVTLQTSKIVRSRTVFAILS